MNIAIIGDIYDKTIFSNIRYIKKNFENLVNYFKNYDTNNYSNKDPILFIFFFQFDFNNFTLYRKN